MTFEPLLKNERKGMKIIFDERNISKDMKIGVTRIVG